MDCSTPGFPVFHSLPEFAQTHVHWVSDAIQPSHPLSPPSPALNLSQHQGLFQWVSFLHQVAIGTSVSASVLLMNIPLLLKSKGFFWCSALRTNIFQFCSWSAGSYFCKQDEEVDKTTGRGFGGTGVSWRYTTAGRSVTLTLPPLVSTSASLKMEIIFFFFTLPDWEILLMCFINDKAIGISVLGIWQLLSHAAAASAAKSLQSCPTLCNPIDGSPPGSPVPGILQARTLEWVDISFSNAWKWKVKVKSLSCARLLATPWTAAYQAPPSMGFSRQEYY